MLLLIPMATFAQYENDYERKKKPLYVCKVEDYYPVEEGKITYKEVVEVPNATSQELFFRAKIMLANRYVSSPDVTKMEDKENGIIVIKAFFEKGHNDYVTNPKMWYTLTIEAREGRYRYTITDIKYTFSVHVHPVHRQHDYVFQEWAFTGKAYKKKFYDSYGEYLRGIDNHFKVLVSNIKKDMQSDLKQDW